MSSSLLEKIFIETSVAHKSSKAAHSRKRSTAAAVIYKHKDMKATCRLPTCLLKANAQTSELGSVSVNIWTYCKQEACSCLDVLSLLSAPIWTLLLSPAYMHSPVRPPCLVPDCLNPLLAVISLLPLGPPLLSTLAPQSWLPVFSSHFLYLPLTLSPFYWLISPDPFNRTCLLFKKNKTCLLT